MKFKDQLEPGVLFTFRMFTGVRMGLQLMLLISRLIVIGSARPELFSLALFTFLDAGLLLVYLSSARVQRALKTTYLPTAIVWATLGPMLEQQYDVWVCSPNRTEFLLIFAAWQVIPYLFIPLVIVGWQYHFRDVAWFCVFTVILDLLPWGYLLLSGALAPRSSLILGILLVRTMAFLFVGKMITQMMSNQRQQQRSLTDANQRLTLYAATLEQLSLSRERNRLAREMQDILAHKLSGVAVELEAVRSLWDTDPIQAQSILSRSLQDTREGLSEARRTLRELHVSPLEDLGFSLALTSLVEAFSIRRGGNLDLRIGDGFEHLPLEQQQWIYQLTQSALTDLVMRPDARIFHLVLVHEAGAFVLRITADPQDEGSQALAHPVDFLHLNENKKQAEQAGDMTKVIIEQTGTGVTVRVMFSAPGKELPGDPRGNFLETGLR
jgi:signal transduction histidine kinase